LNPLFDLFQKGGMNKIDEKNIATSFSTLRPYQKEFLVGKISEYL